MASAIYILASMLYASVEGSLSNDVIASLPPFWADARAKATEYAQVLWQAGRVTSDCTSLFVPKSARDTWGKTDLEAIIVAAPLAKALLYGRGVTRHADTLIAWHYAQAQAA